MRNFLPKFFRRRRSIRQYSAVKFVNSLPDVPNEVKNDIYVVVSKKTAKWIVFDCPCFNGHKITVNLMKSNYPYWKFRFFLKKISLSPSIIVTDHFCRSHFWLESNRAFESPLLTNFATGYAQKKRQKYLTNYP